MSVGRATALLLLVAAGGVHAQETPDFRITERQVDIEAGTTMYDLVRDFYPNHRNDWLRVARDLADANPSAFRNGDPGALIVGKTLKLIDYGDGIAGAATPGALPPDEPADAPDAGDPVEAGAGATTAASTEKIGTVTRLRGAPRVLDRNNDMRPLKRDAAILRGDTILTGDNEPLSLIMGDGAVLRLRGNSRITFEKYKIESSADESRGSILTLSAGGLRMTTGALADASDGVLINTAAAEVTTTGGDIALALCDPVTCAQSGDTDADLSGLYAGVALGKLAVANDAGTAEALRGQVLHTASSLKAPRPADDDLAIVFNNNELLALDLQSEEPLGFFAWFRQRFFSFSSSDNGDASP